MKHLDQLWKLLPQLGNKVEFKEENIQAFLEEIEAVVRGSALGRSPSISPSQTNQTVRQLWFCLNDVESTYNPDQFKPASKMKMLFSSVCEHVLILLLKEAGANIDVPKGRIHVEFTTPKGNIIKMSGTDDYRIDDEVVDCKMPDAEVYKTKFKSAKALVKGDVFGYIPQGNCYAKGAGKEFGGWDICNTSTGEIKHISAKTIDMEKSMGAFFNRYDEAVEAGDVMPDCQFSSWSHYDGTRKSMQTTKFSAANPQPFLELSDGVLPWECSRCIRRDTCWTDLERIDKPKDGVRHRVVIV